MTRVFVFSLLGFFLLTLLSPLLRLVGIEVVTIDVSTIIILHVTMTERRPLFGQSVGLRFFHGLQPGGVALALILGYLTDLLSGGPRGLHGLALAVLYLVGRLAARQVTLVGGLSQVIVTFAASLITSAVALAARWVGGVSPTIGVLGVIFGQAALTAAIAPLLVKLLQLIEHKLSGESSERTTLYIH